MGYCLRQSILKPEEEVSTLEATLLNMLKNLTFSYGLAITQVCHSDNIFSSEILDIKPEELRVKFQAGIANLAVVSLQIDYPTIASAAHSVTNGFKNLLAIAAATEVNFKKLLPSRTSANLLLLLLPPK